MTASRDAEHFRRLYDASADPWQFRTSAYERAKYHTTIAALGHQRFRSGFEVGCSIGVLTRMLAVKCDALLAVDIVEAPLAAARALCADQPWVRFDRMHVPAEWPDATFDLIVLSELLYFLSPADIAAIANRCRGSAAPGAAVLSVNWRGQSGDPCTGDQAADIFIAHTRDWLSSTVQYVEDDYRLDLLLAR